LYHNFGKEIAIGIVCFIEMEDQTKQIFQFIYWNSDNSENITEHHKAIIFLHTELLMDNP
jgi:hypothetical protein